LLITFDRNGNVPISGGPYPIPPYLLGRTKNTFSFVVDQLDFLENAPTIEELERYAAGPLDQSGWRGSIAGYWTTTPLPLQIQQARARRRVFDYQYRYGTGAVAFPGTIIRMSTVRDQVVKSAAGAELGSVTDFVLNYENGRLYFAELSLDRSRGGSSTYLLPVNAFVLDREDYSVEYPLADLGLPAVYGYDGEDPNITSPRWFADARRFWNDQALGLGYAGGMRIVPRPVIPVGYITGYSILTADSVGIGTIRDALITRDGNAPYMIIEIEGLLGIGGRMTLVPTNALSVQAGATSATVDILESQLEGIPTFEPGRLPDVSRPGWDEEFREYWTNLHTDLQEIYSEDVMTISSVEQVEQPAALPVSAITAFDVVTRDGRGAGTIEEVMLDLAELDAAYFVLSVGGFLDIGDKNIAVPTQAFSWDPDNSRLVVGVSRETLEDSPGFDEGDWPESGNTNLEADIADYWSGELGE
jgi:sporulation protein YlmC with PRC-barrel domain